jgi:hypothetical protein
MYHTVSENKFFYFNQFQLRFQLASQYRLLKL